MADPLRLRSAASQASADMFEAAWLLILAQTAPRAGMPGWTPGLVARREAALRRTAQAADAAWAAVCAEEAPLTSTCTCPPLAANEPCGCGGGGGPEAQS